MSERYKDPEWLEREYVEKNRSTNDIAGDFDISHATIAYWLHKNGISTGEYGRFNYICPECNIPYRSIGMHFELSSCERPEISPKQMVMLEGLTMGDGSVRRSNKNWSVQWSSINKEFMEWFDWMLGDVGVEVRPSKLSQESRRESLKAVSQEVEKSNVHKSFRWRTIPHPDIKEKFLNWFEEDKKKFPESLTFNPINLCIWYCCDGTLSWSNGRSPRACIYTGNEYDKVDSIVSEIESLGFNPDVYRIQEERSYGDYTMASISFNVDETQSFLEYMGGPPPGMEYKWETKSHERYQELMENSKEKLI